MGLWVAIMTLLSIFFTMLVFMIMTPIMFETYDSLIVQNDNIPTNLRAAADNIYGMWHIYAVVVIGIITLWGFTRARRRTTEDVSI